jgi:hypothetical protein
MIHEVKKVENPFALYLLYSDLGVRLDLKNSDYQHMPPDEGHQNHWNCQDWINYYAMVDCGTETIHPLLHENFYAAVAD